VDKEQLAVFKDILLKQKVDVYNTKDDSLQSEKMADPHDAAVADLEKTLSTTFISRKKLFLSKIDEALKRIEDGSYGECDSCGDEINTKRLQARPTAKLCLECKEDQETQEKKEKERNSAGGFTQWD
jgi:DnaK suppressor protein